MLSSLLASAATSTAALRALFVAASSIVVCAELQAQTILTRDDGLLTDYQPQSASSVQGITPTYWQRGVQLDGAYASPSLFGLSLEGNPFETAGAIGRRHQSVDLVTGSYSASVVDISLPAPGFSWVIGRTYNGQQYDHNGIWRDSEGPQGRNWFQSSMPELVQVEADGTAADSSKEADDLIYLVYGADRFVEFVRSGTTDFFKATNGANAVIEVVEDAGAADVLELTDARGLKLTFWELNDQAHSAGAASGQLWKVDLNGAATAYVGHETDKSIALSAVHADRGYETTGAIRRAVDSAGREYSYTYSSSKLASVSVEDVTGEICKVNYSYSNGNLELVERNVDLSQSGLTSSTFEYYRYTDTTSGLVEMCLMPEGARRFDLEEGDGEIDQGYITATDSALEPYAAVIFTYDASKRVATASADGLCGCGGAGSGEHTYTYEENGYSFNSTTYEQPWARRVTIERPESEPSEGDETYYVHYFDEAGQGLHKVVADGDPAVGSPGVWATKVVRDSDGWVSAVHSPASVSSYTHTVSGVALVEDNSNGYVSWITRYTTGDFEGFVKDVEYSEGATGTKYIQNRRDYDFFKLTMGPNLLRPLVDSYEEWPDAAGSPNETTYDYTDAGYFAATAYSSLTVGYEVVTLPAVSSGNNGSGTSNTIKSFYNELGEKILERDEDDTISLWEYDGGQVVLQVHDAASDEDGVGEPFENIDFVADGGKVPNDFQSTGTAADHIRLTSSWSYDSLGRTASKVHPDDGRSTVHYSRLSDTADARTITFTVAKHVPGSDELWGPSPYRVYDHSGREVLTALVGIDPDTAVVVDEANFVDETKSDPLLALDPTSAGLNADTSRKVERLTTIVTDESGSRVLAERKYHTIPGTTTALPGSSSNYDETSLAYDDIGRLIRVEDPTGTVDRQTWDQRNRLVAVSSGTDDTGDHHGDTGGTNNMVTVLEGEFDGGSAGGNSYLTARKDYLSDGGTADDVRVVEYVHDVRGLVLREEAETAPYPLMKYDNLGRPVAMGLYGDLPLATSDPTSVATDRLRLEQLEYDEIGRVVRSWSEEVNQSTGAVVSGGDLQTQYWYDKRGRVAKEHGNVLRKFSYDRLDRLTHAFDLAWDNDTTYDHSLDVGSDIVLEERQWAYDRTLGAVILEVTLQRHHDDPSSGGTLGALDKNQDSGVLGGPSTLYLDAEDLEEAGTGDNVRRARIIAHWYDQFTRRTATADFGTNGGADFDREYFTSATTGTEERLLTTFEYGTDGELLELTDPESRVTRYEVDQRGRLTEKVRNYVALGSGDDENQTVLYGYSSGRLITETYENPGSSDQVTTYTYGVPKGTSAGQSAIASNRLIWKVTHPDNDGGATDNVEVFAYDAQEAPTYTEDQGDNVHEYEYDQRGRLTDIILSTIDSDYDDNVGGVDFGTEVQLIQTTYDDLGRRSTVSQYSNTAGGASYQLDLVELKYDDWSLLSEFDQSIDKDPSTAGALGKYDVGYTWERADGSSGGTSQHRSEALRLHQLDYPGYTSGGLTDTNLTFVYSSASNRTDNDVSRVTAMRKNGSQITQYEYLGVDALVGKHYTEIDVASRYYDPVAATGYEYDYDGLDQYGRVTRSKWSKKITSTTFLDFYDVVLGWNGNSSLEYEDDKVLETPALGPSRYGHDADYTIDGLERVTVAQYGEMTAGSPPTISTSSPNNETLKYTWNYDHLGNWEGSTRTLTGSLKWNGATALDESRAFTKANEITERNTDSTGAVEFSPVFDSNGNLVDDDEDYKFTYDPFGNIRFVHNQSDQLVAEYRYNGLGYMISARYDRDGNGTVASDESETEYYVYDAEWRLLAIYVEEENYLIEEFIHNRAGLIGMATSSAIDDVAISDKDPAQSGYALSDRHYLCHNWRNDVVVVLDDDGKVWERTKYKAYGVPFCMPAGDMDCDGDPTTGGAGTDQQTMVDIRGGSLPYDVLGDLDLDNDVDTADITHMVLTTSAQNGGLGVLSGIGSRWGYAGYFQMPGLSGSMWSVRNRVLDSDVGNWLTRDPLGFVDGGNLYEYVTGNPASRIDPLGLLAEGGAVSLGAGGLYSDGGGGSVTWWQETGPKVPGGEGFVGPDHWGGSGGEDEEPEEPGWWDRWGDRVHTALDVAGMCPIIGNAADLINAGVYLVEGDLANAAVSGLGALPGGQLATAGRVAAKYGDEAVAAGKKIAKGLDGADEGARGVIYKVAGKNTPSGKPYIGRTKTGDPAKRGSADGRNREGAEILDTYPANDTAAGRVKEQQWINRHGGVDNLDNKRNEICPSKWVEKGVTPEV